MKNIKPVVFSAGGKVDLTSNEHIKKLDLVGAWLHRRQTTPDREVFWYREQGRWVTVTTRNFVQDVARTVTLLNQFGVKRADRVAFVLPTGYPFVVADFACMAQRAVSVPIYPTMSAEDKKFILNETRPRIIIAAARNLISEELAGTYPILYVDDPALPEDNLRRRLQKIEPASLQAVEPFHPDELVTLVYTSGTTGAVKGVKILASQVSIMIEGVMSMFDVSDRDRGYLFLPQSHIFGRLLPWVQAACGMEMALVPDATQVQLDLKTVRPTVIAVVPRFLEKIYDQIRIAVREKGGGSELSWDLAAGLAITRGMDRDPVFPLLNLLGHKIADRVLYRQIRSLFGGRVRLLISGGAALEERLAAFFIGAGVPVVQGYGMTETTGVVFVNDPRRPAAQGVGVPLRGVQYRLQSDGELCLRGPAIFPGYWKSREQVFDEDGWFHTGDLASVNEKGNLVIKGRCKDIFVTSAGKNIAPQKIEGRLEMSPLIEQAVVVGDNRMYCTALIAVDKDAVLQAIDAREFPSFAVDPRVVRLIDREVEKVNMGLASYETVKYFRIVPGTFSVSTGDLTATLKPRRIIILRKYEKLIEEMYAEGVGSDKEDEDRVE